MSIGFFFILSHRLLGFSLLLKDLVPALESVLVKKKSV